MRGKPYHKCKSKGLWTPCKNSTTYYNCGDEGYLSWDYMKLKMIVCYNYKWLGYISKNYPKLGRMESTIKIEEFKETQYIWVYNLTKEGTYEILPMIQSTMFIFCTHVHALVDLGSMHSFISCTLARSLGVDLEILRYRIVISTSIQKTLKTNKGCLDWGVWIRDVEFSVNLILLEIQDFDIIIGMDFLSKCDNKVSYLT